MRRNQFVTVCVVVAVCALAFNSIRCKDNCTGQPAAPASNPAMVRFIHASADMPAVDCLFDSTVVVVGATFNTFTASTCCYRPCAAIGRGLVSVRLTGGGVTVATDSTTFQEGRYYTVVLVNHRASAQLLVLSDTNTTPVPTEARLRIIDAVVDPSLMDFSMSGKPLYTGLAFGKATPYLTIVKPATLDTGSLVVTREVINDELFHLKSAGLFFPGKTVITLVMLGSTTPNGAEPLPTIAIFQDNVSSIHGAGDMVYEPTFAGLRSVNATSGTDTLDTHIWNQITSLPFHPDWRWEFPGQNRLLNLAPDSMAEYLLLGFSGFDKDAQGRFQTAVRFVYKKTIDMVSDSFHVDPIEENSRYTFAAVGDTPPYSVVELFDTAQAAPQGMSSIRLLNGSPDVTQTISLTVGGQTLFSNIGYKHVTGTQTIPSGPVTITLLSTTGAPATVPVTLQSGEVYTIIAMGKSSTATLRGKVYLK